MSALSNRLITRCIALEVALMATRLRMAELTDREALHDLRIVVRRLRSLLRPLRGLPGVETLAAAAGEVGRLSSPLRDLEVLVEELQRNGPPGAAERRREALLGGHVALLAEPALSRLEHDLWLWPGLLREVQREGLFKGWRARIHRRLQRQRQRLQEALADPVHDRHRLRLLVKRMRYSAEVWPLQWGVPVEELKAAQAALGEWHDRLQWCTRAASEADLQPCLARWQREQATAEVAADAALLRLQEALGGGR